MSTQIGTLYVVATPIGNLGDISARALDVLRACALILAEDTRVTRRLLSHYGIGTRLQAYHDHNERATAGALVDRLRTGTSMALVTDAGTPAISDPGLHLVSAAHAAGIPVRAVPGPSALTAALSVAGLPAHPFRFEGYLPARTAARDACLARLSAESCTLVFLEAPHRIGATLAALAAHFGGGRRLCVARELTKIHESTSLATIAEQREQLERNPSTARGEYVLIVEGAPQEEALSQAQVRAQALLRRLLEHIPAATAVAIAHEHTGVARNLLYGYALALQAGHDDGDRRS